MKTVKKLGKKVKQKHSQYAHLSDEEAGRLVKAQHPGEYDDYVETSAMSQDISVYVEDGQNIYNPDRGRITSWWQQGKSEARGRLLDAINSEVSQLLTMFDQRIAYEQKEIDFIYGRAIQKALSQNQIIVTQMASSFGVSPHIYEMMILKAFESKFELELDRKKMELELEKAERLAQIEGKKDRLLRDNEADVDARMAYLEKLNTAREKYYRLRAKGASKTEIDNARRHMEELEKLWASISKR